MEVYTVNENKIIHHNARQIEYTINDNGCHKCVSHSTNPKGYPMKRFNGSYTTLIRYIWYLNTGEILDKNQFLLHKCDNPKCINFKHLFIGDNNDNMADKVSKKRQARHSNLSDKDIFSIKTNVELTSTELAKLYNVSQSTIMKIWKEETHKYVSVDNYDYYLDKRANRKRKRG